MRYGLLQSGTYIEHDHVSRFGNIVMLEIFMFLIQKHYLCSHVTKYRSKVPFPLHSKHEATTYVYPHLYM